MEILAIVLPVFLILGLGMLCGRLGLIAREGMEGIKQLATSFLLPVVLVNALGTAEYSPATLLLVGVMLLVLTAALLAGYLLRPLLGGRGAYLPFLTTTYEGGMMAYPLYIALCGAGALSNIAALDMANCVFTFTVYLALITATGQGRCSGRDLLHTVLRAPAMYGVALGILLGVTGLLPTLLASPAAPVYQAAIDMLTTPVSALILFCVGYDLRLDRQVLSAAGLTALFRLLLQTTLLAVVWFLLSPLFAVREQQIALVLYLYMPPCFMAPLYAQGENHKAYASTALSLYTLLSLVAFTLITALFAA